jgi:hypothetical protein
MTDRKSRSQIDTRVSREARAAIDRLAVERRTGLHLVINCQSARTIPATVMAVSLGMAIRLSLAPARR